MDGRTLDFIALGILCVVVLTLIYGVIFIHDIPYEIAKKRKHPHQDAIHTAGWVSLFLMHTIWPFLWIWATLYKPEVGWGMGSAKEKVNELSHQDLAQQDLQLLQTRVDELEQREKKYKTVYARHIKILQQQVQQLKPAPPKQGEV